MAETGHAPALLQIQAAAALSPDHWTLLLLADPERTLVEEYLAVGCCFEALYEKEIAGVAVLLEREAAIVELMNIAIAPPFQGRGIGSALLKHVMDHARDAGYTAMTVGTGNWPVDNLAFYQRAGFRIAAVRPDYFVQHYADPIIEDGIQCRDRIDLHCALTVGP